MTTKKSVRLSELLIAVALAGGVAAIVIPILRDRIAGPQAVSDDAVEQMQLGARKYFQSDDPVDEMYLGARKYFHNDDPIDEMYLGARKYFQSDDPIDEMYLGARKYFQSADPAGELYLGARKYFHNDHDSVSGTAIPAAAPTPAE